MDGPGGEGIKVQEARALFGSSGLTGWFRGSGGVGRP